MGENGIPMEYQNGGVSFNAIWENYSDIEYNIDILVTIFNTKISKLIATL